jgi:hypothetical protein
MPTSKLPRFYMRPPKSVSLCSWRFLLIFASLLYSLVYFYVPAFIQRQCSPFHGTAPRNPAYLIEASHGAVASEIERCSVMGVDIMKIGGNAVDAAIAATLCTGVINMFSYVPHFTSQYLRWRVIMRNEDLELAVEDT